MMIFKGQKVENEFYEVSQHRNARNFVQNRFIILRKQFASVGSIKFEKPQNPSCMIWKPILKNLKNLNLEVAGGDLKRLSYLYDPKDFDFLP